MLKHMRILMAVMLAALLVLPLGVMGRDVEAQSTLQLSDFDSSGLVVEFAAVITSGKTTANSETTFFATPPRWTAVGSLTEGELGITSQNVPITRILVANHTLTAGGGLTSIRLNNQPSSFDITTYFKTGGGSDMTLYVQTEADSDPDTCDVSASQSFVVGNAQTAIISCPTAFNNELDGADSGDRFIFAGARTAAANQPPVVNITTASQTVTGGQAVSLVATASDPESGTLTYAWTSDDGGTFSNAATRDTTWTAPAAKGNQQVITLTLTVTDDGSPVATATDTVVMTINADPSLQPPGAPSAPSVTAQTLGNRLSVAWTAPTSLASITSYDLQHRPTGTSSWTRVNNVTSSPSVITGLIPATAYEVQVRATSSNGDSPWSASGTATTTNQPPSVNITTSPQTVAGGQQVSLSATATDPEGYTSALTYAWTSAGGGSFGSTSSRDTTWTAPAATRSTQTITLTLTVTDNGGTPATGSDTVVMTINAVANRGPIVTINTASQTVSGGQAVTLSVSASDPEADTLSYAWTLDGVGTLSATNVQNPTWTAPAGTSVTQTATLRLTVTDNYSPPASTTASVTFTVAVYVRPLQYSVPITLSPTGSVVANQYTPVDGTFITELKDVGVLSNETDDIDVINRSTGSRVGAFVPLNHVADPTRRTPYRLTP